MLRLTRVRLLWLTHRIESKQDKNDSLPKIQPTIEIVIQNAEHSKAEIKWALKSISAGYSNNSCYDIANLFRDIFPCQNSKLFQLGPAKLKYITKFWHSTLFQNLFCWKESKKVLVMSFRMMKV